VFLLIIVIGNTYTSATGGALPCLLIEKIIVSIIHTRTSEVWNKMIDVNEKSMGKIKSAGTISREHIKHVSSPIAFMPCA